MRSPALLGALMALGLFSATAGLPLSSSGDATCAVDVTTVFVTVPPDSNPAQVTLQTTVRSIISTTTVAATTVTIALSEELNSYASSLGSSGMPDTVTRHSHVPPTAPAAETSACSESIGIPSSPIAESGTSPVTASPSASRSRRPQGFGPFTVMTETFTIPLETVSSSCPESSSVPPPWASPSGEDTSRVPASPSVISFTLLGPSASSHHRVSTITQGFGGPRKTITIDSTSSSSISMFTASFTLTLSGNVPPPLTSSIETGSTQQPPLSGPSVTESPTPVVITISHVRPTSRTTPVAQPSQTVPEGAPSPSIVTYTVPGSQITSPATIQGYTSQGELGSSAAAVSGTTSAITVTLHPGVPTSEVASSVLTIDVPPPPTTLPAVPSTTDEVTLTQYPTPPPPPSGPTETPSVITFTISIGEGGPSSVVVSSTAIAVIPSEGGIPPWSTSSITESVVTYTILEGSGASSSSVVHTTRKPRPFAPSFHPGSDAAAGPSTGAVPSEITLWPTTSVPSEVWPTTPTPAASSTDFGPPEITIWPTIPLPPASSTISSESVLTLTLPPIPFSFSWSGSPSSAVDTSLPWGSNPGISSIWTPPPEISSFGPSVPSSTCATLTPPESASSSVGGKTPSAVSPSVITISASDVPTSWTGWVTVGFTTVGGTSSFGGLTTVLPASSSSSPGWLSISSPIAAPTDSTIVITLPSIPPAETSLGGYGVPSEATSVPTSSTAFVTIPGYETPIPAPSSFRFTSLPAASVTPSPSAAASSSIVLSGTGLPVPITTLSSPRPLTSGVLPPNITIGNGSISVSPGQTGNVSFTSSPSGLITTPIPSAANATTMAPPFPMNTSAVVISSTGAVSSSPGNASAAGPVASANTTLSASELSTASSATPVPPTNTTFTIANGTSPGTARPTGTGLPPAATSNGTASSMLPSSNGTLSSLAAATLTGISSALPANASMSSMASQSRTGAGPISTGNSTFPISSTFLNSTVAPEASQTGLSPRPMNATTMPTPLPSQSGIIPNITSNLTVLPPAGPSRSGSVATSSANMTAPPSSQTGAPPPFTGNGTVSRSFPSQTVVGPQPGANSSFPTMIFPSQSGVNGTSTLPSQTGQFNVSANGTLTSFANPSKTAGPITSTNGTFSASVPANQTGAGGAPSRNTTVPTTSFSGQTGGAGPALSGNGSSSPFPSQTGLGGASQTSPAPSSLLNTTGPSTFPSQAAATNTTTAPTARQTGLSANSSLPRPNQSGFPPTASLNQTGLPAATAAPKNQTQSGFAGATSTPGSNQTVPSQAGFPPASSSRNATGTSQSGSAPLTSSLPTAPNQSAFGPSSSAAPNQTIPNVGGNQTVPGQTVAGSTTPLSSSIPGGSQQGFPPITSSFSANSSSGGLAPTASQAGGNQSATAPTSTAGANQGIPPAQPSTAGVSQSAFPAASTASTSSSMSGNWSSTSATPSPSPTCGNPGDTGNFTLSFDDLPARNLTNSTGDGSPFINPYHRFWFTPGFTLLPPPVAPYVPTSPGKLVQYRQAMFPNGTVNRVCQIGVGDERSNPCMRFTMLSFNLGCNSTSATCQFNITGQQNPGDSNVPDTTVVWNVYNVTACPGQANCSLTPVVVDSTKYTNLSAITIQLSVDGDLSRTWWGDDLRFGWTNNSCDMASCRSKVRNTVGLTRRYTRSRNQGSLWRRMIHAH